jgi:GH25 family lysozyme M1 (1,4-beta-N-acetylmuramidase)
MSARSLVTALAAAVLAAGSTCAAATPAASARTAPAARTALAASVPGFDISGATTGVDWTGVVAAGAKFVFITATEGTTYQYPNFPRLSAGAYAAGLIRGAAHVAVPSASGGAAQADFFAAHGGAWSADHQTLPGTLDLEYNPYGAICYGLSQSAMTGWITEFVNEYHARTGRWAIIYTSPNWWKQCTGGSADFGSRDPLWVAAYATTPPLPAGWTAYTFWQYADAGTFPGGQDVFNGTADRLLALADGTP